MPRILAVDWGERRIGLAVCDPTGTIASGLDTLVVRAITQAPALVAAVAAEVGADSIVVGLPLLLSGEHGAAAQAALAFADQVREASGLPVHTYDERLTSAQTTRRMHERGERARSGKGRVDQGAAVALLESWLMRLDADRRREAEA